MLIEAKQNHILRGRRRLSSRREQLAPPKVVDRERPSPKTGKWFPLENLSCCNEQFTMSLQFDMKATAKDHRHTQEQDGPPVELRSAPSLLCGDVRADKTATNCPLAQLVRREARECQNVP